MYSYMRTPVKQLQDYADLNDMMSMCLHEATTKAMTLIWKNLGTPGKGAAIGLAAMLPFVPGMLGSRKKGGELRDIYSGVDPVPVHAGRWWEVGSTPFEGARIKEWRPHWSILHKSHAEDASLYGSEEEKWKHNPILHPDQVETSFFPIRHLSIDHTDSSIFFMEAMQYRSLTVLYSLDYAGRPSVSPYPARSSAFRKNSASLARTDSGSLWNPAPHGVLSAP